MSGALSATAAEVFEHRLGHTGRSPAVHRRRNWLVAALLVAASSVHLLAAQGAAFNPGGLPVLGRFLGAALHPEVGASFLQLTWDATLTTLAYAVLGTLLSLIIGGAGGVLASETFWHGGIRAGQPATARRRLAWLAARASLGVPRGIHEAVWALLLAGFLGAQPLVAILAIGIPYGAVTAKVFAEVLDEAPAEAYLALRGAGAGRLAAIGYGVLPAAAPDLVSYAFYRFECSIRAAAVLGFIGAGGLGFQLALSFQSLRYSEMWTLILALFGLGAAAEIWSTLVRRQLARPAGAAGRSHHDPLLSASLVIALLLVPIAWRQLDATLNPLWSEHTWSLMSELARESWPPELSVSHLRALAGLSLETVEMSMVAIAIAAPLGLIGAAIAAAHPRRGCLFVVSPVCRALLLLARTLPPPVWALLLIFVLLPGPLPGALALAAYTTGILGRLLAGMLENADPAAARALRGQGASGLQALIVGVLPTVAARLAGLCLYRWEVTFRETVVVGLVGAGGLGRLLNEQLAAFDRRGLISTVMTLVLITIAVDLVGSSLRRALR